MNGKENNKHRDIYYWIIIIILIIIILLLVSRNRIGKLDHPTDSPTEVYPTGNVEIFDISIDDISDLKTPTNSAYPKWSDVNKEDSKEEEPAGIYVDDKEGNYIYHQRLRIFENPFFEYEDKIAPGVSNSYSFVVHNNSDFDIQYNVDMYETCEFDIDLKYRLRRNGQFVLGNEDSWVRADDLKTEFTRLNQNDKDNYILDWEWDYESGNDEKDTYIGKNMTDIYKLSTKFHLEQV